MKCIIEYESPGLLPEEFDKSISFMKNSIFENKYEPDKILLAIERMKGDLIKWLSNNRKMSNLAQPDSVYVQLDDVLGFIKSLTANDCGCVKKHDLITRIRQHFV